MATKYLQSNQNLSTATWYDAASGGSTTTAPGNGDTIDLNGFVLTMNQTRLPATGTLAEIKSTPGGGYVALALNTVGSSSIYCTTIKGTSGTAASSGISVSGTTANTLSIYGNLVGGGVANANACYHNSTGTVAVSGSVTAGTIGATYGLYNRSTGAVTVSNGNVTGGAGGTNASIYGIYNYSTGTVTISGNVTGGVGAACAGIYNRVGGPLNITGNITGGAYAGSYGIHNASTGAVSITNGTISDGNVTTGLCPGVYNAVGGVITLNNVKIQNRASTAYIGKMPVMTTNYSAFWIELIINSVATKLGIIPAATTMVESTVCGNVVGTRVDALVNKVVSGYTYGNPDSQLTGTRTDAPEAKVESGYKYGDPSSQFTGLLEASSSGTPNFLRPNFIRGGK